MNKFKVWDKQDKGFIIPEDIFLRFMLSTGELFINGTNFTENFIVCKQLEVKDLNGNEIHEGDIVDVALENLSNNINVTYGVVEFQEYEFVVVTELHDWPIASWSRVYTCKVLGNIYENPNLIEKLNNEDR